MPSVPVSTPPRARWADDIEDSSDGPIAKGLEPVPEFPKVSELPRPPEAHADPSAQYKPDVPRDAREVQCQDVLHQAILSMTDDQFLTWSGSMDSSEVDLIMAGLPAYVQKLRAGKL